MFRIAMVQMNPTVGDLDGNVRRIVGWLREARKAKPDLVTFPELAITGNPPGDLLLKRRFVEDNLRALAAVVRACRDLVAVVGYVGQGDCTDHRLSRRLIITSKKHELYNAAALISDCRSIGSYYKWCLSNFDIFDERRYFHPGVRFPILEVNRTTIGVNIREDIESPEGPPRIQAAAGAEVIVNINASPFHMGKSRSKEQMLATRARENGVIVTCTNTVGGQDEFVFDGNSVILDHTGDVIARATAFQEDLLVADLDVEAVARGRIVSGRKQSLSRKAAGTVDRVTVKIGRPKVKRTGLYPSLVEPLEEIEEVYQALVLGVKDYVRKNGFKRVVIGLSGGVDSALTAVITTDALGAENVLGIFMPSPYTSQESGEDISKLARRLRIEWKSVAITPVLHTYRKSLMSLFEGTRLDSTEENLQARIRGNILMAVSNKFGYLVLTTGNKSEMSVGYATLYGDMAGGFAVIKDVPKTMVYDLARFRNLQDVSPVIPKRILDRPPSAELRPNQKDEDSLPPYPMLDPILQAYMEEERSPEEIVEAGFEPAMVGRVITMVDRSEFKRRQAPIGIKIMYRAFGKDRRMPITNGYRTP